jgi:iron(III) transport system ATP-binding protein
MSTVVLRDLTRSFGNQVVVRGVDLDVVSGSLVALLGPSGCGKTTTLRMIAGLDAPTSGVIELGGLRVNGPGVFVPPERRRLGMVFQSYAVWPHMNVLANVRFPLDMLRVNGAEANRRALAALDMVDLRSLEMRYPHQLSGGQQQRVALARALVAEPQVLLLDEPLSNLDATLRTEMRREIRELARRVGLTVILVTHDRDEALSMADQVAVMLEGRIRQMGPPAHVYNQPADGQVARLAGPWSEVPAQVVGGVVLVDGVPTGLHHPTEGRFYLGFRPDSVGFSANGPPARLAGKEYLGDRTRLTLEIGGIRILMDTPTSLDPPPEPRLAWSAGTVLPPLEPGPR